MFYYCDNMAQFTRTYSGYSFLKAANCRPLHTFLSETVLFCSRHIFPSFFSYFVFEIISKLKISRAKQLMQSQTKKCNLHLAGHVPNKNRMSRFMHKAATPPRLCVPHICIKYNVQLPITKTNFYFITISSYIENALLNPHTKNNSHSAIFIILLSMQLTYSNSVLPLTDKNNGQQL